ncbi:SpoIID/LytB domain-containing protein [Tumidithrix elongata RA019]|uniref:SpoIID/LytB domain-containing protein n=1 Tax=Tumidithrix elongata BACA0141 TaxID=2716417 RepID=A0AAW9PQ04_9CYAN|nr:SpoIID/LytB domain-containing protein [Tumidithrix elongata RA019]
MNKNISIFSKTVIGIFCIISLSGGESLRAEQDDNPIMRVGIVQRFGANPQDRITIKAPSGDTLTLSFKSGETTQTVTTSEVVLEINAQPLAPPIVEERIVLSNHRSFENAAASAFHWQEKGIATEIAQPKRWQVWAKRDIYDSSLLRQLLLFSLRIQGNDLVQIERKTLSQKAIASWVVGNFRYNRDRLDISSGRGIIEVNNRPYAGTLRLQPNAHHSYTLVNNVPLETYLRGVVPHEIGYDAPYPAVQAQAVLARTYILASRHRFVVDDYDLCATTQCQVYQGLEGTSEVADRAIADTRSRVLTFNNRVVDALYSSTTGGVTADYNDIWDGKPRPYLKSIVDAVNLSFDTNLSNEKNFRTFIARKEGFNEAGWHTFRWKKDGTLDEIKGTLQNFLRLSGDAQTRFNQIKQIQITERAASGRVQEMEVETDTGKIKVRKDEIMDAFEPPDSLLFYIQPIYEENSNPDPKAAKVIKGYSFIGGGLGHGVGMSQTGSYRLARMGWPYDRILSFYYTGTQLQVVKSEFWQDKR